MFSFEHIHKHIHKLHKHIRKHLKQQSGQWLPHKTRHQMRHHRGRADAEDALQRRAPPPWASLRQNSAGLCQQLSQAAALLCRTAHQSHPQVWQQQHLNQQPAPPQAHRPQRDQERKHMMMDSQLNKNHPSTRFASLESSSSCVGARRRLLITYEAQSRDRCDILTHTHTHTQTSIHTCCER